MPIRYLSSYDRTLCYHYKDGIGCKLKSGRYFIPVFSIAVSTVLI